MLSAFLSQDICSSLVESEVIYNMYSFLGTFDLNAILSYSKIPVVYELPIGRFEDHRSGTLIEGQVDSLYE